MKNRKVIVNDKMQHGYTYICSKPQGRCFADEFEPELTPKQMLKMGIFGGKYMTDCIAEYPASWFKNAKLAEGPRDKNLNCFRINASKPLSYWESKEWIYEADPRGWFQWYCRYYMGRRCEDDQRQIKRWKAMRRHACQLMKHCASGDLLCRPRQRQALLHWAYDSRNM